MFNHTASPMVDSSADARPIYTIDADNRFVFANAASISLLNATAAISQPLMGRIIWEFVPTLQIRRLWEVLYARARTLGAPVFVPMRADTPSLRRLIDLELHPLPDGSIQHICECVWTEVRAAVALLDPSYPRDQRSLLICTWCDKVRVSLGVWEEIEQAQRTLRIEAAETLPTINRGCCGNCKQSILKAFLARVA